MTPRHVLLLAVAVAGVLVIAITIAGLQGEQRMPVAHSAAARPGGDIGEPPRPSFDKSNFASAQPQVNAIRPGVVASRNNEERDQHPSLPARLSSLTLSPEEEDILRRHGPDELPQLIYQADVDFMNSNDSNRKELERRYLLLLNLSAKLSEPPPVQEDSRENAFRVAFQEALKTHESELKSLGAEERRLRIEAIKEAAYRKHFDGPEGKTP